MWNVAPDAPANFCSNSRKAFRVSARFYLAARLLFLFKFAKSDGRASGLAVFTGVTMIKKNDKRQTWEEKIRERREKCIKSETR